MQNLLAGTTFSPHILPCDEVDATESGDADVADDVEDDAWTEDVYERDHRIKLDHFVSVPHIQ